MSFGQFKPCWVAPAGRLPFNAGKLAEMPFKYWDTEDFPESGYTRKQGSGEWRFAWKSGCFEQVTAARESPATPSG